MRKLQVLIVLYCLAGGAMAQDMAAEEIDFKADFIARLAQTAEWPGGKGKDSSGTTVIGLVGQSPLAAKLEAIARDSTRKGPHISIKQYQLDDNLASCHILFLSTKETSELAKILKKVEGRPVLTVSDAEYFARYGVMINFHTETEGESRKFRFQINRRTLKEAGIKLSDDLLKRAILF